MPTRMCKAGTPYIIDRTPGGKVFWGCRACDWMLETDSDEPIEHVCGRTEVIRLGDKIESALAAVGVTKDRWVSVKSLLGLPATCRCDARQTWLNQLDANLGLGEKLGAVKASLGWSD